MRLDRGNSDHPVAAADAATAVEVEDTVAVAKVVVVASEEATRSSHTALGYACRPGKALPWGRVVAVPKTPQRRGDYIAPTFGRKFGQGWIRTSEGVKPADLQSAP